MSIETSIPRPSPVAALSWPKHLRTPTELARALRYKTKQFTIIKSPTASRLVLQLIGSLSYFLAHKLNKSYVKNIEVFQEEVKRVENQNAWTLARHNGRHKAKCSDLETQSPLITMSNHISCIDDPVLWATLLPLDYYYTKTESVRWVGAAVDICFTKPWHTTFFSLGKTFPIIRGAGLEQPAMDYALALLKHNQWLHLFPEGRVMRNEEQQILSNKDRGYTFKWGISKLILDYFRSSLSTADPSFNRDSVIRILPFYHLGMDKVLPVGRPYVPKTGHSISVYFRPEVIKMNSRHLVEVLRRQTLSMTAQKSRTNDEILRIKLTNYLEQEIEKLIEPAAHFHAIPQDRPELVARVE